MSYPVDDIVKALKTNRREFGDIFLQSQNFLPINQRMEFEVIATAYADDKAAFKAAVTCAVEKRFIDNFLLMVVKSTLETGDLTRIIKENSNITSAALEAMTNPAQGFGEPGMLELGVNKHKRLTGLVKINGVAMGSGVLVKPNMFLTAWHVTMQLFDANQKPIDDVNLTVEFDDFLNFSNGKIRPNPPLVVSAHKQWYVSHSACHSIELQDQIPQPPDSFGGHWDYTIIKLEKPLGYERSWVKMNPRTAIPPENTNIIIFQHPAGQTMKYDISTIKNPNPPNVEIPQFRFLHQVNALNGSSGSPCFDNEFNLVGIHQGKWPNVIEGEEINRGIPLQQIMKHISSVFPNGLPQPEYENPFWCFDKIDYEPIIGRDAFQIALWESVTNARNKNRFFEIKGREGSGKTFMTRIAMAALNDNQHLKLLCPGEAISKMDVEKMVAYMYNLAGIAQPQLVTIEDYNSTVAAWVRYIINENFIDALDKARNGRTVWLIFDDLNKYSLQGTNLSEFVLALFECVKNNEWLRIVTDAFPANLPIGVQDNTLTVRTEELTLNDIKLFLNKVYAELEMANAPVDEMANMLFDIYTEEIPNGDLTALTRLKKASYKLLQRHFQ